MMPDFGEAHVLRETCNEENNDTVHSPSDSISDSIQKLGDEARL